MRGPDTMHGSAPIYLGSGTAAVPLGTGRGFALIDAADAPSVAEHRWYRADITHCSYAITEGPVHYLHRLLLDPPAGMDVDHINHDGLDNRRSNLRLATRAQNSANQRPRGGTSRHRGVYLSNRVNRTKRWRAQIKVDGHRRSLGDFLTEDEAALAYNVAALAAWGDFALLNTID